MNEAWLDENLRFTTTDLNQQELFVSTTTVPMATMTKISLVLGRCQNPSSGEWPNGTDFTATGKYGRYIDIPLKDAAKDLGFLLLDRKQTRRRCENP